MTRLLWAGFLFFLIVCPADAVFTFREAQSRDIWRDWVYMQSVEDSTVDSTDVPSAAAPAGVKDWFTQRLAGDMLGDDFLLGPVSIMRLSRSDDKLLAFGSPGFDLHRCNLYEGGIQADSNNVEEIVISQTPAPNALLIVLVAVASVGWLRCRLARC